MTADLVALCRRPPDREAVLAALRAAGPELHAHAEPSDPVVRLTDRAGHPLLAVDGPLLVQVPGEVERLLGISVDGPIWWIEIRAVSDRDDALEVARRFAERLAGALEGTVWP